MSSACQEDHSHILGTHSAYLKIFSGWVTEDLYGTGPVAPGFLVDLQSVLNLSACRALESEPKSQAVFNALGTALTLTCFMLTKEVVKGPASTHEEASSEPRHRRGPCSLCAW